MRSAACNERREGADDRHEAGEQDGLAAVAHVEVVSVAELLFVDPGDVAAVDAVAEPAALLVAERVACDGADDDGEHDEPGTGRTGGGDGACNEEEESLPAGMT